jgi:hypothetical protein
MTDNLFQKLTHRFPFISVVQYGAHKDEYVGIIQNYDPLTTGFYDFGLLHDDDEKRLFLSLAERWYFESNRQLPINIYLKWEWKPFEKVFKTFMSKEISILMGPVTSLAALSQKKKRRSINIVKRLS